MSFNQALKHTLQSEGGYVNDPDGSGGKTFRGVSRRNNPKWAGWQLIDAAKRKIGVKRLTLRWTTIDKYFKDGGYGRSGG